MEYPEKSTDLSQVTKKPRLSANQLFSLIDMKRKFINSDNHKFHQYPTFKTISVTNFVAENGVPREIHRPVASH
jgi:hypothetical protein